MKPWPPGVPLLGLFVGATLRPLPPEGQPTGMFKEPVDRARIRVGGIVGDRQGDRRVHGGPEKAVHLFTREAYARIGDARPDVAELLRPGILGENLSTSGLIESEVCIGDVYALGSARIQVSQPRSPCWKIDNRLGTTNMVPLINGLRCPGWYFRVLGEGTVTIGDNLQLIERPAPDWSLARMLATLAEHRPDPADLRALAVAPGLNEQWQRRCLGRADWLSRT
jgi:MOSC domain-containing protein YiiM